MLPLRRQLFVISIIVAFLLPAVGFAQQEESFDLKKAPAVNSGQENPEDVGSAPQAAQEAPKQESVVLPEKTGPDDLISVNFENVDIRDVIRILADKAQINMVVGPDVGALVNLQLNNVSWQKALEVILTTYNLTFKKDGELIRIITLDQMALEDQKVPLSTKIVTLNFARAGEVKGNFENMLTSRGRIDVNDRTNSLIITDIPDSIKKIEEIAEKLDTRTPQVMIEALMADVKNTDDDQLGINWTLNQEIVPPAAVAEKGLSQVTMSAPGALGQLFNFGTTILADKDLHATLAFLQTLNRVNVLAHPQVTTLDNLAAKINLTEEIPYQESTTTDQNPDRPVVTTAFKTAGINLTVTPHITTKDNFIYLTLDVKHSFRSGNAPGTTQPIIDSRSATTNVLVRNGETAVIGGLRRKNDSFTVTKFPLLGDIPMLGSLFRSRNSSIVDTDLLVFVTPRIVEQSILSDKEEDRLQLFKEEPQDWANQFDRIKRDKGRKTEAPASSEVKSTFYLRPPQLSEGNYR